MIRILLASFVLSNYSFADSAAATKSSFDIMQFVPFILIFVVFYFLLIRPQQTKMKQHQALLAQLKRGDKVMTAGGIIANVDKIINSAEISLEISDGVKVRFAKNMVTEVIAKTTPIIDKTEEVTKISNVDKKVKTVNKKNK